MPPVTTSKLTPPANIPEEWQKANEALQLVAPKSGKNDEKTSNNTEQSPVVDVSSNFEWQSTYTGYPGYINKFKTIKYVKKISCSYNIVYS